jgi:hypothetical protein
MPVGYPKGHEPQPGERRRSSKTKLSKTKKPWEFLEYLKRSGGLVSLAVTAYLADGKNRRMSRHEHCNWLIKHKWYATAVQDIKEGTIDMAEAVIFRQLKQDNLAAAQYYLNHLAKVRGYNNDKLTVEHTGGIKHDIVVDFGDRPQ